MTSADKQLTPKQQQCVQQYLPLVRKVITDHIFVHGKGLDWNDLYQTGCLALCNAAARYDASRPFAPYAAQAIKNSLYDYCRNASLQPSVSLDSPAFTEDGEASLHEFLDAPSGDASWEPYQKFRSAEALRYLKEKQQHSSGAVQKGIYCLLKKCQGYNSTDISRQFGVTSNLVRAWMSLAARHLKKDPELYELLSQ